MPTKIELMKKVKDEILSDKTLPLYAYRTENKFFPVIGEGSHDASIIFIGEAPGLNEAKTAKPFCGAAGRILDQLLASISLDRESVYITNTVKDRPPDNRDPLPEEIEAYTPFLIRQIDIIKPRVIATLGRYSMAFIFNHFGLSDKLSTIGKIHGQVFEVKSSYGTITVIPLYHPAMALYNGSMKPAMIKDFEVLKKYI
jgi:DNA polymerase